MKKRLWFSVAALILVLSLILAGCTPQKAAFTSSLAPDSEIQSEVLTKEETSSEAESETSSKTQTSSKPKNETSSKTETSSETKTETSSQHATSTVSNASPSRPEEKYKEVVYYPDNNPAPKKIQSMGARVPSPFSYSKEYKGEKIDFTQETLEVTAPSHTEDWWKHVAVIRSSDDLYDITNKEINQGLSIYPYRIKSNYDDEYFKDNVLIMLFFRRDANLSYTVEELSLNKDTLYIKIKDTRKPDTMVITLSKNFRMFITIPKKDFESVKKLSIYETKLELKNNPNSSQNTDSNINEVSSETSSEQEAIYYPENNPAPIKLNGKNAATPTPISFTKDFSGKSVEFYCEMTDIGSTPKDSEWHKHIAVIRTHEQLCALSEQETGKYSGGYPKTILNFCNEEYFKENLLVVLFYTEGSSGDKPIVEEIVRNDKRLNIKVRNGYKGCTCDMATFRNFIEFSKKDLDGVTEISVNQNKHVYG